MNDILMHQRDTAIGQRNRAIAALRLLLSANGRQGGNGTGYCLWWTDINEGQAAERSATETLRTLDEELRSEK